MSDILVNMFFFIIEGLSNVFVYPLVNIIFNLFPNLSTHVSYIYNFFNLAFTYLTTVYRWFLFTPTMFALLFDYFVIKYSIWAVSCGIRFGIKLYNALKI